MIKVKLKIIKILIISALVISIFLPVTHANTDLELLQIENSANALVALQILKGDEHGNLKLQDSVSRCEFTTLILRILGKEGEEDVNAIENPFTDLDEKHWAYNNIIIATKYNLINGYEDKTFRPDNNVTFTEARAIIVRALGYESQLEGNWPDNVINMSKRLGLDYNLNLPQDKEITRGEASVLIYNALTIPLFAR
ncbi:MAG TPA: S-layer homology domain-containing protein [Clostridiaceae bacterium]|nr:S-layer homology domain-containing protein [Clostridiaceae bacterium]